MHNLEDLNLVLFGFVAGLLPGLFIHLIIRGFISIVKEIKSKF